MIQESLQAVGAARSIVIDEDGTILAGNGTVEAAGAVGIDRVRVVEASGNEIIAVRRRGLSADQKKQLAYYDNLTAEQAEWDMEQVASDVLQGYDFLEGLFDDFEIPEPPIESQEEFEVCPECGQKKKQGV